MASSVKGTAMLATIWPRTRKIYTCKVLTAGTPSRFEGRTYTAELIEPAAKTLSYRPLNINHFDPLPFPDNMTLEANWNPYLSALFADIQVEDSKTRDMITSGEIQRLSVEALWIGARIVAFTAVALVTNLRSPIDKSSRIY